MTIYFVLFFLFMILSCLQFKTNENANIGKIFIFFAFASIFFLAALRGDIDRDHENYENIYSYVVNGQNYLIEPTFYAFSYFSKLICNSPVILFIIFALIGVYIKSKAILKLSVYPTLAIFVYYCDYFLLHEMTQIRVGVAAGICFLSLHEYVNGNKLKFIYYIAFATIFHVSAMLFVLLLFIPKGDIKRKEFYFYITLLIASYTLYFSNYGFASLFSLIPIDFVQQKFLMYSQQVENGNSIDVNVFSILQIIKIFSIVILYSYFKINNSRVRYIDCTILRLYIYSCIAWVIFFDIPAFAIRISELFGFSEVLLLPILAISFKQKSIGLLIVILICSLMFYINIFHNELLKPYITFW